MKKYLLLMLAFVNTVLVAVYVALIPKSELPMHYDFSGRVDRFGSKWELLLISIIVAIPVVVFYVYRFIKGRDNCEDKNQKYIERLCCGLFILFTAICWFVIFITSNGTEVLGTGIYSVFVMIIGMLFAYMGNFFGKIKPNRMFGIRTRATLNNDVVWRKTHRLGGYFTVTGGAVLVILGVLGLFLSDIVLSVLLPITIVVFLTLVLVPVIYAQAIYKKEKSKGNTA